ncbi:MAG: CDP-2,3-bis-(O-geranylgeranyl)-sn-glycerol synthase [Methanobacteriota archaeon]|nr:MAG: CDP-2,3-bis-(O-geranylgeranyl)-sn-glycerol synthase [Euryarchaeota archaeon]
MDPIVAVLQGLWLMIPAYVANPAAVLFGGGKPIDGGAIHRDGRRYLGDGKTWRGLAGGTVFGMVIGFVQMGINMAVDHPDFSFGSFPFSILVIFLLPFGALLGDMLGSYIKRRMGIERGQKALGLDQYDFLVGVVLLVAIFQTHWFLAHYIYWEATLGLIAVLVITPVLHRVVNIIGYRIGKKEVPW